LSFSSEGEAASHCGVRPLSLVAAAAIVQKEKDIQTNAMQGQGQLDGTNVNAVFTLNERI
jgi:hypothetical protein